VEALRAVSRSIAVAVATEAIAGGLAGIDPATDVEALVDDAMWWPEYVPYVPARPVERRRDGET
jgi:malic enzyme